MPKEILFAGYLPSLGSELGTRDWHAISESSPPLTHGPFAFSRRPNLSVHLMLNCSLFRTITTFGCGILNRMVRRETTGKVCLGKVRVRTPRQARARWLHPLYLPWIISRIPLYPFTPQWINSRIPLYPLCRPLLRLLPSQLLTLSPLIPILTRTLMLI